MRLRLLILFCLVSAWPSLAFSDDIVPASDPWREVSENPHRPEREEFSKEPRASPLIKICSWNIYKFGDNKPADVIKDIVEIIEVNACDVLSIQEITARNGVVEDTGIKAVRKKLNENLLANNKWELIVSTPVDHGQNSEAYAIIYNHDTIEYLQSGGLVAGSGMDRAPHVARFKAKHGATKAFDFILMSVHTKTGSPDLANDMAALRTDIGRIRQANPQEPDVIVLGDFNIQPSTQANSIWQSAFSARGRWALDRPDDSSMAHASILNDNLVWGPPTYEDYANSKDTDHFEDRLDNGHSDRRISDHVPTWGIFYTDRDMD